MNKEQIIAAVSDETNYCKSMVEKIVNCLLKNVVEALANGERVQFRGFGTFEMKERAKRVARNPHSNEVVYVPAKSVPSFIPGYGMKCATTRIKK